MHKEDITITAVSEAPIVMASMVDMVPDMEATAMGTEDMATMVPALEDMEVMVTTISTLEEDSPTMFPLTMELVVDMTDVDSRKRK